MGRSLTNNFGLAYNIEASLGVAGTVWNILEPNDISTFGANISTVARDPISKNRQRRKGTTTDLDSAVEFEGDWTLSHFQDFIEGFAFAVAVNADMDISVSNVDGVADEYDVAALTAAQADKLEFALGQYATLIYGRGFSNAANNGLKSVDADIAASATAISVAEVLVDEASPPANARVELAGLRSLAAAADFTWDWDAPVAGQATLSSAADITDFTQFGLTVGQVVHIGSPDGSGGVTNAFQNVAANDMFGYARIVSFGTGTIVFDKVDPALQFDDATAPTTAVDILFGKFVRNVAVDDPAFLERSFQFEGTFQNLENPGPGDEFEYAIGNLCDSVQFQLPLTDKAVATFGFIGLDTESPSTTQKTGADTPISPSMTAALNTTSDIARLRIQDVDESGLSTDFKSLNLTLNNNVSPEKVLAQLGAKFMNFGTFEVDIEAQLLFTNGAVIDRIRQNTTVTMDFIVTNDDGGVAVDIPSMDLGGGGREFPRNESILVNLTGRAFQDPVLGYSIGVSTFPVVP